MPIYEYKCGSCSHQFETIQKFSDEPLTECPACGAHTLKKLVSAAAFHLKGSGWYATDFKNSGKKENGATGTASDADVSSSDSSDSDSTKPETDKKSNADSESSSTTSNKSTSDAA